MVDIKMAFSFRSKWTWAPAMQPSLAVRRAVSGKRLCTSSFRSIRWNWSRCMAKSWSCWSPKFCWHRWTGPQVLRHFFRRAKMLLYSISVYLNQVSEVEFRRVLLHIARKLLDIYQLIIFSEMIFVEWVWIKLGYFQQFHSFGVAPFGAPNFVG